MKPLAFLNIILLITLIYNNKNKHLSRIIKITCITDHKLPLIQTVIMSNKKQINSLFIHTYSNVKVHTLKLC